MANPQSPLGVIEYWRLQACMYSNQSNDALLPVLTRALDLLAVAGSPNYDPVRLQRTLASLKSEEQLSLQCENSADPCRILMYGVMQSLHAAVSQMIVDGNTAPAAASSIAIAPHTEASIAAPSTEASIAAPPTESSVAASPTESSIAVTPTEATVAVTPTEATIAVTPTETTTEAAAQPVVAGPLVRKAAAAAMKAMQQPKRQRRSNDDPPKAKAAPIAKAVRPTEKKKRSKVLAIGQPLNIGQEALFEQAPLFESSTSYDMKDEIKEEPIDEDDMTPEQSFALAWTNTSVDTGYAASDDEEAKKKKKKDKKKVEVEVEEEEEEEEVDEDDGNDSDATYVCEDFRVDMPILTREV